MSRRYYRVTGKDHREGSRSVVVRRPSGLVELAAKQLLDVGYRDVSVRRTDPPPPVPTPSGKP